MLHTRPRTDPIASPAAGADITFVPTQIDQCVVMTFKARLTTSAVVANRLPALVMKDINGNIYVQAGLGQPQAASLAVTYTWARAFGAGSAGALVTGQSTSGPLPDAWLQPGDTIGTATTNLDVGDQWDQVVCRYYVGEHWLRLRRELAEATLAEHALGQLTG
jgi:hypothetical protein